MADTTLPPGNARLPMCEQQAAPQGKSKNNEPLFSPDVAVAMLRNIGAARAILRTVILAIGGQLDGAVSYPGNEGSCRWQFAVEEATRRLHQAREVLMNVPGGVDIDWVASLTLAEALESALWFGYSCTDGERLDNDETMTAARAVVDAIDNMLRECEAAGVNQIASLSHVSVLH